MAQFFAMPYIFPDVAQYPDLRFDGDSVSSWIEQVVRIFERARLSYIEKIAEAPYWTKNETYQERVKFVVNRLDNWNAATKALKSTFAFGDPRQLRSAYDYLKDLKNQPLLSNPSEIYTYCLDHEIQAEETKDTARVPSDLDCTRGLFERIHGHSLEDIMNKGKMTYEELFKMEYSQAQKLVRGWAKDKVNLDNHTKRAERYFSSDQSKRDGKRGPEESQLDLFALTERLRALEIRLCQVGPSDNSDMNDTVQSRGRIAGLDES
ncbi:uncharacterized protein BCR38DRAFT_503003 [Pseudomassariella vexata]|uniref:Uncharacterized protein n=1 Tax=Pseudomassariella vexata TaxID=1141098 RepID=A0A1Y2EEK1_9PEZI|nr:uncharacterized protein BCR38DRAFT_503003 [Pseudomassariella vexata]ORY69989.1 hypothetical protein BCR38DRAFT_503003 [Pseudomassariella vexata]